MDTEKIKFSIRMDEELVRTADAYVQEGMALSRTEMIEDALRFYLGFLSAEKSEDYLLQSLSSMLGGTVKDSENRLARMDFKMAVELAKLCHVIAYIVSMQNVWRKSAVSTEQSCLRMHTGIRGDGNKSIWQS